MPPRWTRTPGHTRARKRWCSTSTIRSSRSSAGAWSRSRAPGHGRVRHAGRATCRYGWLSRLSRDRAERGVVPLERDTPALRYAMLRPGPELAMGRLEGLAEVWRARGGASCWTPRAKRNAGCVRPSPSW